MPYGHNGFLLQFVIINNPFEWAPSDVLLIYTYIIFIHLGLLITIFQQAINPT